MHFSNMAIFAFCLLGLVCGYFSFCAMSRWFYQRKKAALREKARQLRQQRATARTTAQEKLSSFPQDFHNAKKLAAETTAPEGATFLVRLD